jgi:SPP1 family predicted phage head-tail adaptor
MKIGDLRHRITLQAKTSTSDAAFGETVTWTDIATMWAAIWPVSASETISNMQNGMTITHRIRIRYRRVLKSDWQISFADRTFNIVSIIDQGMNHQWIDILCKEAA